MRLTISAKPVMQTADSNLRSVLLFMLLSFLKLMHLFLQSVQFLRDAENRLQSPWHKKHKKLTVPFCTCVVQARYFVLQASGYMFSCCRSIFLRGTLLISMKASTVLDPESFFTHTHTLILCTDAVSSIVAS